MSRRALALGLAGVLACGCLYGSRPQLPTNADGGLGGTANHADASDPSRNHDATAMPPITGADAAVDVGVRGDVLDAGRDALADRPCAEGDAGDAPDAADAHDGAHACDDGDARPVQGAEVHP